LESLRRTLFESPKLTRLDQILNALGIKESHIQNSDFQQRTENGKLIIEPCPLSNGGFKDAETMYNICINVWSCKRVNGHDVWKRIRNGDLNKEVQINLHRNVDRNLVI